MSSIEEGRHESGTENDSQRGMNNGAAGDEEVRHEAGFHNSFIFII